MVFLILHERSSNKACPHIQALNSLGIPITLISDIPVSEPNLEYKNIVCNLSLYEDIVKKIKSLKKKPRYFTTVSENLLVLVARLEEFFNLPVQIPISSAEILADKYLLAKKCAELGFEKFFPENWLCTSLKDFNKINPQIPILVKPTIGSGSNIYFKKNEDLPHFEYFKWDSINELKKYLIENDLLEEFFQANKRGFNSKRFAQTKTHFQIQPYYWSDNFSFDLHGFTIHKKHFIYGKSHVARMSDETTHLSSIAQGHIEGRKSPYSRERLAWLMPISQHPLLQVHQKIIETLISALKINNLIYAGPSYYQLEGNTVKALDLNPRISGVFSLGFTKTAPQMMAEVWKGWLGENYDKSKFSVKSIYLWGACLLRAGQIQRFTPPKLPPEIGILNLKSLKPGKLIPEKISLQTKGFNTAITVVEKSQKSAFEKYLEANSRIQSSIEYF